MSENIYPIDAALDLAYAANQEPNVAARALLIEMAGVVINRDPDSPLGTYVSEEGHDVAEQAEAANIARAQSLLDHIRSDRTIGNLIKRHQIKQAARFVFDELGFVEVDTPVLGSAMTEYTKDNFRVTGNAGEFFLPQSPQVYMKIMEAVSAMTSYTNLRK
jgi:aspartyl-tRNA synthetase